LSVVVIVVVAVVVVVVGKETMFLKHCDVFTLIWVMGYM
jgi:hypothetical protein